MHIPLSLNIRSPSTQIVDAASAFLQLSCTGCFLPDEIEHLLTIIVALSVMSISSASVQSVVKLFRLLTRLSSTSNTDLRIEKNSEFWTLTLACLTKFRFSVPHTFFHECFTTLDNDFATHIQEPSHGKGKKVSVGDLDFLNTIAGLISRDRVKNAVLGAITIEVRRLILVSSRFVSQPIRFLFSFGVDGMLWSCILFIEVLKSRPNWTGHLTVQSWTVQSTPIKGCSYLPISMTETSSLIRNTLASSLAETGQNDDSPLDPALQPVDHPTQTGTKIIDLEYASLEAPDGNFRDFVYYHVCGADGKQKKQTKKYRQCLHVNSVGTEGSTIPTSNTKKSGT
ncbi:hypothetical protein BLNAU_14198 [Blattamonas nauphoetae]|uniref:Uncharacterized protein n=1 Tax=Blattamonas nauphoetae TaxID=2049346 RepID=A0ABQ9XG00_9EUKA|nr:hypothetical protein BLNAU_14198 [Blattamonas nauphoetae]